MPQELQVFHENYRNPVVSVILPESAESETNTEIKGIAMDLAAATLRASGVNVEEPHREYGFDTQTVEVIESPFVQEHLFFNNIRRAIKTVKDFRASRQAA
jgi:hypothetical protein